MKKSFILVYSPSLGTRDELKKFLNARKEILSWRMELANCIFLISESDTAYLSGLFRGFDKGDSSFLVMEMSPNRQGWLSPESWKFLKGEPTKVDIDEDVPF